jgi:hypothetical protein
MPGNSNVCYDFVVCGKNVKAEIEPVKTCIYMVYLDGLHLGMIERNARKKWALISMQSGKRYGGDSRERAVSAFVYAEV